MENSIYLGVSRQLALQTNMEITANNVANINTPGYRGQNLVFDDYISDPRGGDDPLSFPMDQAQYQLTAAGAVSATENPFDIAIDGPGFIGIEGPGGQTTYTRAGNFELDIDSNLITPAGYKVASNGGGNITIPQGSSEIKIDENGFVSNQDGQIGQIMLVEFENLQALDPLGNNMYTTDAVASEPTKSRIRQGYLEGANVNPVIEMTRMIETLRSFQSVQNVLQTENERLRTAVQKLTKP